MGGFHIDICRIEGHRYRDIRIDSCQYGIVSSSPSPSTPLPCCTPLAGAVLSEEAAAELASILKALADPVRLRLVSIIANAGTGEVCACDLPDLLGRSQATVSHHLGLLVRAGILQREQRGKWAWFRLHPERLATLGRALTPAADPW